MNSIIHVWVMCRRLAENWVSVLLNALLILQFHVSVLWIGTFIWVDWNVHGGRKTRHLPLFF